MKMRVLICLNVCVEMVIQMKDKLIQNLSVGSFREFLPQYMDTKFLYVG